jgi:hypothetical protein
MRVLQSCPNFAPATCIHPIAPSIIISSGSVAIEAYANTGFRIHRVNKIGMAFGVGNTAGTHAAICQQLNMAASLHSFQHSCTDLARHCGFPFSCGQIEISCLNSVAPHPLNWPMWCPGKDAKIQEWIDKSGATHRQITLRPQKNMTSSMAIWFISSYVSGLMPPYVEFQGAVSCLRQ